MTETIFDATGVAPVKEGVAAPTDAVNEATPGYLGGLVGPDKKFKSVEDLAHGKAESDIYIARLEQEAQDLRADLAKKTDADQTLEQLRQQMKELKDDADKPKDNTNPELTTENIAELVKQSVTALEVGKTADQNVAIANAALVKHYGDVEKARAAFAQKATELGMPQDALRDIAAKSPTAFAKLIATEGKPVVTDPLNLDQNDVNTSVNLNPGDQGGLKAHYDKMRRENDREYWKPETQQAIFAAQKAGTYL